MQIFHELSRKPQDPEQSGSQAAETVPQINSFEY
jgi:hypothetical protein